MLRRPAIDKDTCYILLDKFRKVYREQILKEIVGNAKKFETKHLVYWKSLKILVKEATR